MTTPPPETVLSEEQAFDLCTLCTTVTKHICKHPRVRAIERATLAAERERVRAKLIADADAYQSIGNGLAASALRSAADEL